MVRNLHTYAIPFNSYAKIMLGNFLVLYSYMFICYFFFAGQRTQSNIADTLQNSFVAPHNPPLFHPPINSDGSHNFSSNWKSGRPTFSFTRMLQCEEQITYLSKVVYFKTVSLFG